MNVAPTVALLACSALPPEGAAPPAIWRSKSHSPCLNKSLQLFTSPRRYPQPQSLTQVGWNGGAAIPALLKTAFDRFATAALPEPLRHVLQRIEQSVRRGMFLIMG